MGRSHKDNTAKREAAQQGLLRAALEVFAAHGLSGATIAHIARRAGVSKGLAYHYYPSKEALLHAVIQRRIAQVHSAAAAVPPELSPPERLSAIAHAMVEGVVEDPGGFRLYVQALASPGIREAIASPPQGPGLQGLFVELKAEDAALEARFFQTALLGILVQHALSPVPCDPHALADHLLHATLGRIGSR